MISFKIFKNITSKDDLKELSHTLLISEQPLYEYYQEKVLAKYGSDAFPYISADPYFTECEENFRHKFIEIGMDDNDRVALFIKFFAMFGNNGAYLWFKPISLNDNKDNEELVLQILKNNNLIDYIMIPKVLPNVDYTKLRKINDDYYCNVHDRVKEVNRSKYRSAKGINKIDKEIHINTLVNQYNPDDLQELSYYWWKLHNKQNKQFDRHLQKFIDLQLDNKSDVLTWELNNKLIGFTIICYYFGGSCARIHHNRTLLKTEIDDTDSYLIGHLADYMHYHTIQFLNKKGVQFAYIGDSYQSAKYLAPYKARNFKLRIDNYELPLEESYKLFE